MTDWRQRNVRIEVTAGHYHGRRGRLIRPDGALPGVGQVWLVKLDGAMSGAAVGVQEMRPET